jgi:hypothetical protein
MFQQIQMMQKMMKDENFRKLMANPRVQELIKDQDFVKAMQDKDTDKLATNPRLLELQKDPELRELISKLDLAALFGGKAE